MMMPAEQHDLSPGHQPVLVDEVIRLIAPVPGKVILDCTIGRAGHCRAMLERLAPGGGYVGLDLDGGNLEHLRKTLTNPPVPLHLVHCSFDQARQVLDDLGIDGVDGLLADLGFSSSQMADPARGLSFRADGPLDMRLDRTGPDTAADLLARLSEAELADLIWRFGEERFSRPIARKIVEYRRRRPIKTTRQLAELCTAVYARAGRKNRRAARRWRIHPATRTFQALRIAVNDELGRLDRLLRQIPQLLRPEGRAVIISFHSLEDRLVKRRFRYWGRQCRCPKDVPVCSCEGRPLVRILTKRPVGPSRQEVLFNPRARSARMRVVEKV